MAGQFLSSVSTYMAQGGFVMPPLVLGAMLLWYAVGYRYLTLDRGTSLSLLAIDKKKKNSEGHKIAKGLIGNAIDFAYSAAKSNPQDTQNGIDQALFPFYQEAKSGRSIIRGIVSVAPLIGLLGTVAGMIETFDSLGDMTLFASSGGIAGGISQALFSTQMGLCVAVPGVIAGRLLDKKQEKIEDELDQVKAFVGARA